jgi:hypothetical protein
MTAFMGSPASGGALALGAALAFGIYFIWEGATFNEATFDEVHLCPLVPQEPSELLAFDRTPLHVSPLA